MASAAGSKPKKVITIQSKEDFDRIVNEAGNKHVLVEFFATWCGPCAIIGPRLEEFAHEYEDCLVVVKIDVDDHEDLAEEYDISSMPSFLIIKNKVKLEQFVGSSGDKVQSTLQKFCGKPEDRKSALPTTSSKATAKPNKLVAMLKAVTPSKVNDVPNEKK